ncbi:hypothetical protein N7539_007761 [Penicillium diatomitis]|uniref:Haloacid dehalogenase-like hydrolase n=1 Tax=Penicillium diatomitis TaxID=2819901 RepID=A0A9W9WU20_9EURO|nr:uncharacterized protein N7539_007761 [Penicillium diatomitis]KAJ5475474.1 hypothetical protein N7539_007761 [Penicillium diatomitis]
MPPSTSIATRARTLSQTPLRHQHRHLHQHRNRPARTLLLTFDAFETLFYPCPPVPDQYAAIGHSFGLSKALVTPSRLKAAFKHAFQTQTARYPNYGRADVLRGRYAGPRQWWEEVIRRSFATVLAEEVNGDSSSASTSTSTSRRGDLELPSGMIEKLLDRFMGDGGYRLYDDVLPFFAKMRDLRASDSSDVQSKTKLPFDRIVLGVISNSDDRVPEVLKSLGLRVGRTRADVDRSSTALPGFEEQEDAENQHQPWADSGLADVLSDVDLDLVITSYEAGAEKPDRLIYDVAKRQARRFVQHQDRGLESRSGVTGMEGEESDGWTCVHVGDDFKKDYAGAVDAGWKSYLLQRDGDAEDSATTIQSLMALYEKLDLNVCYKQSI